MELLEITNNEQLIYLWLGYPSTYSESEKGTTILLDSLKALNHAANMAATAVAETANLEASDTAPSTKEWVLRFLLRWITKQRFVEPYKKDHSTMIMNRRLGPRQTHNSY